MEILSAIVLGTLFGLALYVAGATFPSKLRGMLRLENLELMKIIIFGIGLGSTLLAASYFIGIFDVTHLNIKSVNSGVLLGGIVFGIGFGVAGTCPGTAVAAIGTNGIKRAVVTVAGGLLGAFVYSISYGWFSQMGWLTVFNGGKLTLFQVSEEYDAVFGFGYDGLLIVGVLLMIVAILIPMHGRKTDNGIGF